MEETKQESAGEAREQMTDQQIIGTYRGMLGDVNQLRRKIAELEQEVSEHQTVMDTLKPMDGSRRAYRLVGGVLVERTVGEVLPTVTANQESIKQVLQQLAQSQSDKEKAAAEWKVKYKIRSQQEAQAIAQSQELVSEAGTRQASQA